MTQRTVRVRIAVIVDGKGQWTAFGASEYKDKQNEEIADGNFELEGGILRWVEADVPIPEPQTIPGVVKEEQ